MTDLTPRTVAQSAVRTTTIVMPHEANAHGNIFGGTLMSLVDKTAAVCAQRHCQSKVVTASIERVDFVNPLKVGHVVNLHAYLCYVGRTSMQITVEVTGEEPIAGTHVRVCEAITTFVAVDDDGKPTPVPPLQLETDEQRARYERGKTRKLQPKPTQ